MRRLALTAAAVAALALGIAAPASAAVRPATPPAGTYQAIGFGTSSQAAMANAEAQFPGCYVQTINYLITYDNNPFDWEANLTMRCP
ncbi:hypothetical protein [Streptantibioticus silvisoli]|uniref:Uncharacterized protein n=1 Tax=Streptantibioticus silvisoli TaxID=2705255 RepID=A0ABT6VYC9_9ACTN|nr:hypothetical protein [Streptantibioticus silvisoli]MDI5963496.1 hypothetical protein [Streptantibioticus silvisoli]